MTYCFAIESCNLNYEVENATRSWSCQLKNEDQHSSNRNQYHSAAVAESRYGIIIS